MVEGQDSPSVDPVMINSLYFSRISKRCTIYTEAITSNLFRFRFLSFLFGANAEPWLRRKSKKKKRRRRKTGNVGQPRKRRRRRRSKASPSQCTTRLALKTTCINGKRRGGKKRTAVAASVRPLNGNMVVAVPGSNE